ncbi:hypothetical protein HELRODRAFT_77791 [Helobdella robusta]|uniref:SH2 domain-containing protein n=1 Tax=Helobdella robusta TaxID=6412 RepID=T1G340_HELRO|nr:hypothetical protein HELRODRAFT_77791 [Helobdella robusta]ESO05172.1 hypothetical protein HELRODRAFT_77791 [Helobdella robusta]
MLYRSWYHPCIDRHIAESLLMQNGEEGHYLLRPNIYNNVLTVSVRAKDSVKHFQVTVSAEKGEIAFGLAVFKTVKDFLKHFNNQPLIAGESGLPVMLKSPYPNNVAEISQYEHVKVHAEMRVSSMNEEEEMKSTATKEGFLTKLGGVIKNWKCRWCVLNRLELKYYKQRQDGEPLRTIDLRDCLYCTVDTTQKHSNCFALCLPWRTFYFSAASQSEMEEWMKIINWKLVSDLLM